MMAMALLPSSIPVPRAIGTKRRIGSISSVLQCWSNGDGSDSEELLLKGMEEDIKRMGTPKNTKEQEQGGKWGVQEAVDKVLIGDFFFVLLALAWFLAGVGEKVTFNKSGILDAWYPLWPSLFQPALGLLMAGALLSAFTNKK